MRTDEWLGLVLDAAARATLVFAAAWGASLALRRASAAVRHAAWAAALLSALALPALMLLLPAWPVAAPAAPVAVTAPGAATAAAPVAAKPAAHHRQPIDYSALLLALWAAGAAAVVARLLAGAAQVGAIARRATPLETPGLEGILSEIGLRRAVELRESPAVAMPLAWGFLRPMVLVPGGAGAWPAGRLRAVLRHELAHIRRRDWLLQVLSQVACAMYWFHPLAWLAAARLRREREQACDDLVLALGTRPPEYAQHLLELARSFAGGNGTPATLAMARPSSLAHRLAGILDPRRDRRAVGARGTALAVAGAAALLLVVAARTAPAQNPGAGLRGIVTDASGARVPGAQVRVTFPGSDRQEVATAGAAGEYRLQGLPEGPCTVEIRSPGFATFQRTRFPLHANSTAQLDVTLELGRVEETIEVVGKRATAAPPAPAGPPQRIRVGGNVQATRLLYSVQPVYPEDALQRGVAGTVLLQAVISINGDLLSITPRNSAVDPALAAAAVDAVRQWRYKPTLLNGQPVEVVTTITVSFRLAP